jgi:hypothetical protein
MKQETTNITAVLQETRTSFVSHKSAITTTPHIPRKVVLLAVADPGNLTSSGN